MCKCLQWRCLQWRWLQWRCTSHPVFLKNPSLKRSREWQESVCMHQETCGLRVMPISDACSKTTMIGMIMDPSVWWTAGQTVLDEGLPPPQLLAPLTWNTKKYPGKYHVSYGDIQWYFLLIVSKRIASLQSSSLPNGQSRKGGPSKMSKASIIST